MLQPANVKDDFRIHNLVPCYCLWVWLAGVVVGWRVLSSEIPALNNLCQSMISNTIPEIYLILGDMADHDLFFECLDEYGVNWNLCAVLEGLEKFTSFSDSRDL